MISASSFRNALALAALLVTSSALAEPLTRQQLIQSLDQVSVTASAIDPAVLMDEVTANVGKGVSGLPDFTQLAAMPQLTPVIDFEYGSVAIVPDSYRAVGVIADALHYPTLLGYRFLIVGHTDSTGDADANLKLSLRRAEAIRDALSTTFAVPPDQLFAIGVGEEMPLDAARPTAAANRRVQLINIGRVQ